MCDLNWCTVCDKAIHCESNSLYCSNKCFLKDANHHLNQDIQLLLRPKIHYRSFCSQKQNLPELSIYTTSTSSTTFTDISAQNETCCDYCSSTNKNHALITNALGPFDLPVIYNNLDYRG